MSKSRKYVPLPPTQPEMMRRLTDEMLATRAEYEAAVDRLEKARVNLEEKHATKMAAQREFDHYVASFRPR